MFLNELAEPQILVIYPGRFQPFHKGHHAVYEWLSGKFGRNNVYIATSNKTDNLKSPFSFAEKAYFMQLTGVPADRIVQASQPYQIDNVLNGGQISVADPSNTVVIFAVSQKDMDEDPRFSFAPKKDGSQPYFQPLKDIKQTESMEQHGYIMTVPTFDFTVAGAPMRSGTELRKLYAEADEPAKQAIIKDLFGRYTREAEQIMSNKIPAEKKQVTGLEPVQESSKHSDPKRQQLILRARQAHPLANSDEEALALYINDKEEQDIDNVEREEQSLEDRVSELERQFQQLAKPVDEVSHFVPAKQNIDHGYYKLLAHRYKKDPRLLNAKEKQELHDFVQNLKTVKECGGTGVIANKKQANDPRYKTSLTKDVRPGQIGKSLRAFNLAEQGAVDALAAQQVEYISQDIAELKQRITTEKLPPNYVEAIKKKIAQLEQERVRITLGR